MHLGQSQQRHWTRNAPLHTHSSDDDDDGGGDDKMFNVMMKTKQMKNLIVTSHFLQKTKHAVCFTNFFILIELKCGSFIDIVTFSFTADCKVVLLH